MTYRRRLLLSDATFFVTCVTFQRRPCFADPELAQIVADQWKHYATAYQFDLMTYSVMPDHYHVVTNVGEAKTISQILHAVNSYTATLLNQRLGQALKIKIWEGHPWDEVIRDEDMLWQKIAYTLFNPWRAGLVPEPLTPYPFSDLGDWLQREGPEFMLDLFARYKRWHE
jgi:putative transposase